jgi:hypothetical protein
MKQRPRIHYTESQKALMWERWRQGDSLQMIAQLFGRNRSSIQGILAATGGIRPAQRCRSKLALTLVGRKIASRPTPPNASFDPFVNLGTVLIEAYGIKRLTLIC